MLRALIIRAVLFAVPFVVWFVWREVARRTGRQMGSTPWGWLIAAGAVLAALSIMATAVFHRDNRGEVYVPPDTGAGGRVEPGHFEKRQPRE